MSPQAFFAGSFDPPTLGHLDLIERACARFDAVVIGIGRDPAKTGWLKAEQRRELLLADCAARGLAGRCTVLVYTGATVEAARTHGCTVLLRGLRNGSDLEREEAIAAFNLALGVDTLFLLARPEHRHISSRMVHEAHLAGLPVDSLVSPATARALSSS